MAERAENVSFLGILTLQPNEVIQQIFSNLVNWDDFKRFYDQLAADPLSVQYLSHLTNAITELDFTNGSSIREPWTHPEEPWIHPKYPFPSNLVVNKCRQVPLVELQELKIINEFLFEGLPDPSTLSISETQDDLENQRPKLLPRLEQYRIALSPNSLDEPETYDIIGDPRARYLNIFTEINQIYFDNALDVILTGLDERVRMWGSKFIFAIPGFYYIEGTLWITLDVLKQIDSYNSRNGHDLQSLQINKLIIEDHSVNYLAHFTMRKLRIFNMHIPTIIFSGQYLNNIIGIPIPSGTRTIYVLIKAPEFGRLNPNVFLDGSKKVTEVIVNPPWALTETEDLRAILGQRFPHAVIKAYRKPTEPVYE